MSTKQIDALKLALEAGISESHAQGMQGFLECFAALVAAAEREVCAQVCESMRPTEREFDQRFYTACTLNANAIRNRSIQ